MKLWPVWLLVILIAIPIFAHADVPRFKKSPIIRIKVEGPDELLPLVEGSFAILRELPTNRPLRLFQVSTKPDLILTLRSGQVDLATYSRGAICGIDPCQIRKHSKRVLAIIDPKQPMLAFRIVAQQLAMALGNYSDIDAPNLLDPHIQRELEGYSPLPMRWGSNPDMDYVIAWNTVCCVRPETKECSRWWK